VSFKDHALPLEGNGEGVPSGRHVTMKKIFNREGEEDGKSVLRPYGRDKPAEGKTVTCDFSKENQGQYRKMFYKKLDLNK